MVAQVRLISQLQELRAVQVGAVEQFQVGAVQEQVLKDLPVDCHDILVHQILLLQAAAAARGQLEALDHFHRALQVVLVE